MNQASFEEFKNQISNQNLQQGGLLGNGNLRSLHWKLYLGVLPRQDQNSWINLIQKERQCYLDLKEKFIFDPSKYSSDLEFNNPLSLAEEVFNVDLVSMEAVFSRFGAERDNFPGCEQGFPRIPQVSG